MDTREYYLMLGRKLFPKEKDEKKLIRYARICSWGFVGGMGTRTLLDELLKQPGK